MDSSVAKRLCSSCHFVLHDPFIKCHTCSKAKRAKAKAANNPTTNTEEVSLF